MKKGRGQKAEHTKVVWECKRRAGGKKEMPHAEHTSAGGKKKMPHAEHTKVVWEMFTQCGARTHDHKIKSLALCRLS